MLPFLFSFKLLVNVVSHDTIVRMVLVRVMAFVKNEQCEKTQRCDIKFKQCILHDLWSHNQNVILRCQFTQWQLGILVTAQTKSPQFTQVLLEHALLLCHQSNGWNKEYYFGISAPLLPAFVMMLSEHKRKRYHCYSH